MDASTAVIVNTAVGSCLLINCIVRTFSSIDMAKTELDV